MKKLKVQEKFKFGVAILLVLLAVFLLVALIGRWGPFQNPSNIIPTEEPEIIYNPDTESVTDDLSFPLDKEYDIGETPVEIQDENVTVKGELPENTEIEIIDLTRP